ncbi:unnamed protein product [Lota lota]
MLSTVGVLIFLATAGQHIRLADGLKYTTLSPSLLDLMPNTQAANDSMRQPSVLPMYHAPCREEHANFCLNEGRCMYPQDTEKPSCMCERGYYGPRCAHLDLVFQPMREEQLVLIAVCVVLLFIGLSGAFYFFYKWYRRNKCPLPQKRQGYMGVESA